MQLAALRMALSMFAAVGTLAQAPTAVFTDVYVADENGQRTQMRWIQGQTRISNMANPFAFRHRAYYFIPGEKAHLRLPATPTFELTLPADVYPDQAVMLLRLRADDGQREVQIQTSLRNVGTASFSDEDKVALAFEPGKEASAAAGSTLYRVSTKKPLERGEFALVFGSYRFYDFGIDVAGHP